MRKTAPMWGGLLFVGGLGKLGRLGNLGNLVFFEGEYNAKSAKIDNFYLSIL